MQLIHKGASLGRKVALVAVVEACQQGKTQIRSAVIADTAIIPFNKKCRLEEWSGSNILQFRLSLAFGLELLPPAFVSFSSPHSAR